MLTRKLGVACIAVVASVTGCAEAPSDQEKAPSDQEVETAFRARVADSHLTVGKVSGIRCRAAAAANTFDCDVTAALTPPGTASATEASGTLRVIRTDGSWTYDPDQALDMSGPAPNE